jgi:hypothetical protein
LRDELGLGDHKEEFQHQEINTSTSNYQVSIEPTPFSLILVDTSLVDEQQTKVEPLEHMKEV